MIPERTRKNQRINLPNRKDITNLFNQESYDLNCREFIIIIIILSSLQSNSNNVLTILFLFSIPTSYKGVCLSCKESIMRGTRYNAKKVDTKEKYFTSKIWEFQMACLNCKHPFIIRTNPKERGFDYIDGIKIQAGQQPSSELLESTGMILTNMNAQDGLAKLEKAAQKKRQRQTEYEELQGLQKLNETSMLNDADSNANVRARFRKDRKDKRARIQQASSLGWRDGMEIAGPSLMDAVAAKEAVFGRPKVQEKKRFGDLKKSSIFSARSEKKSKKRNQQKLGPGTSLPVVISSSNSMTATPQSVEPRRKKKIMTGHAARRRNTTTSSLTVPLPKASSSLCEMMAAYGSDSDEN